MAPKNKIQSTKKYASEMAKLIFPFFTTGLGLWIIFDIIKEDAKELLYEFGDFEKIIFALSLIAFGVVYGANILKKLDRWI